MKKYLTTDLALCVISLVLSGAGLYWFQETVWLLPVSMLTTCFIGLVLKLAIVQTRYKFSDFFIGENETYSLSRFQFFLWVLIIVSSQIALIAVLVKEHRLDQYNLIVGEHVLWILAASFGTLLSVQGIAMQKKNTNTLKKKGTADFKDLIVDDGKLDFTRFQMLMWTVIAIVVYYFQSVSFLNDLRTSLLDASTQATKTEVLQSFDAHVRTITEKAKVLDASAALARLTTSDLLVSLKGWNDSMRIDISGLISKSLVDRESADALIFELTVTQQDIDRRLPAAALPPELKLAIGDEIRLLQNITTKSKVWIDSSSKQLEATEAKIAAPFIESDDDSKSPVPDISLTFLILMGLVQGAYVGKKLLPVDASGQPTTTLPGTFVPVTDEGKKTLDELKLKEALEIARSKFLPRPNVTGVDIGLKRMAGQTTDQKVLRIHVATKMPADLLDANDKIPDEINGVKTDVIQSNFSQQSGAGLATSRTTRNGTLQPGISIGDETRTGTLGLIVTHIPTNAKCVLSNYHVLKGPNVCQPGVGDGGNIANDKIAEKVDDILDDRGDAAICKITDATRVIDPTIFGTNTVLTNTKLPNSTMTVKKSGKVSGVTEGRVVSDIGHYKIKNSTFIVKGFLVESKDKQPITQPGDSGSVWFDETTSSGVGLHIGIDESGNVLACLLTDVLEALKAKI